MGKNDKNACCPSIELRADGTSDDFVGEYEHSGTYGGYASYKHDSISKTFYLFYRDNAWIITERDHALQPGLGIIRYVGNSICPEYIRGRWSIVRDGMEKLGPKVEISCKWD